MGSDLERGDATAIVADVQWHAYVDDLLAPSAGWAVRQRAESGFEEGHRSIDCRAALRANCDLRVRTAAAQVRFVEIEGAVLGDGLILTELIGGTQEGQHPLYTSAARFRDAPRT